MRAVPDALKAHLAEDATTTCQAWRVTRRDGVVMGFTDHDHDLVFDDTSFLAAGGFEAPPTGASELLYVKVTGRREPGTVEDVARPGLGYASGGLAKAASFISPTLGRVYDESVAFGKEFPGHNTDGAGDAAGLKAVGRTAASPALPFIAGRHLDGDAVFAALDEAIRALDEADRARLHLHGLMKVQVADYLDVPDPGPPQPR